METKATNTQMTDDDFEMRYLQQLSRDVHKLKIAGYALAALSALSLGIQVASFVKTVQNTPAQRQRG